MRDALGKQICFELKSSLGAAHTINDALSVAFYCKLANNPANDGENPPFCTFYIDPTSRQHIAHTVANLQLYSLLTGVRNDALSPISSAFMKIVI
jgi:hypothetical protein